MKFCYGILGIFVGIAVVAAGYWYVFIAGAPCAIIRPSSAQLAQA